MSSLDKFPAECNNTLGHWNHETFYQRLTWTRHKTPAGWLPWFLRHSPADYVFHFPVQLGDLVPFEQSNSVSDPSPCWITGRFQRKQALPLGILIRHLYVQVSIDQTDHPFSVAQQCRRNNNAHCSNTVLYSPVKCRSITLLPDLFNKTGEAPCFSNRHERCNKNHNGLI